MSTTFKPLYAAKTGLTVTLDSLAANGQWQTTAVDNSTNLYEDAMVSAVIVTGSGAGTNGVVNVYAVGSDGSGTYTDGAGVSDAAITLPSPPNAVLVAILSVPAASTTYHAGPFPVARAFGGRLPDHWGLVFENKTAGALGSGNSASYQGVNTQGV